MKTLVFPVRTPIEINAQGAYDREWLAAYRVYTKATEPHWLEFKERLARAKEIHDKAVGK